MLAVTLFACVKTGGQDDPQTEHESAAPETAPTPEASVPTTEPEKQTAAPVEEPPTPEPVEEPPTPEPVEEPSTPEPAEPSPEPDADALWTGDRIFTFGTLNGDTYESLFLGYGFTLENWVFADKEKIAEINRWDAQMLPSELQEEIRNADMIVEMFAESANGIEYLNIQYQKSAYLAGMDPETIVDMAIPELYRTLESAGYRDVTVEKTTVTIGGDTYHGVLISAKVSGFPIYQKQAFIQRGEYVAYVTVSSRYDNTVDDIFAAFYKLV
jgi:hypothetical protein